MGHYCSEQIRNFLRGLRGQEEIVNLAVQGTLIIGGVIRGPGYH